MRTVPEPSYARSQTAVSWLSVEVLAHFHAGDGYRPPYRAAKQSCGRCHQIPNECSLLDPEQRIFSQLPSDLQQLSEVRTSAGAKRHPNATASTAAKSYTRTSGQILYAVSTTWLTFAHGSPFLGSKDLPVTPDGNGIARDRSWHGLRLTCKPHAAPAETK